MALSEKIGRALKSLSDRHSEHLSGLTDLSANLSRLSLRARTVLSRFKVAVKELLKDVNAASEVHSARLRESRRDSLTYGRRISSKERQASKEPLFIEKVQAV